MSASTCAVANHVSNARRTDVFTRWSEVFAVSNALMGMIVALLDSEVFPRYGYPKILLTDNGTQFTGRRWAADCRCWGVERHTTLTYHPRANPMERRNQDINVQLHLRLGDDHSKWDVHLPKLLYCMRRRVNAITGHSPVELLHGQYLALPGELQVAEASGAVTCPPAIDLREEARRYQAQFLATRTLQSATPPTPLEPGQMVYARCHHLSSGGKNYCAGLSPKWAAPWEVLRRLGPTTYLIRLANGRATKIHRDDLHLVSTAEDPSEGGECPGAPTASAPASRATSIVGQSPYHQPTTMDTTSPTSPLPSPAPHPTPPATPPPTTSPADMQDVCRPTIIADVPSPMSPFASPVT
ncbi:uncharacterized protein K02A2.6-like [Bacillus rossius redtenbacheri]|uniref:uncharacterized protein K02A2.6-like n=1 Tax=Bacillus rossius redtenbacheri TaxID=93214 RepID=UPI002FDDA83F